MLGLPSKTNSYGTSPVLGARRVSVHGMIAGVPHNMQGAPASTQTAWPGCHQNMPTATVVAPIAPDAPHSQSWAALPCTQTTGTPPCSAPRIAISLLPRAAVHTIIFCTRRGCQHTGSGGRTASVCFAYSWRAHAARTQERKDQLRAHCRTLLMHLINQGCCTAEDAVCRDETAHGISP